MVPQPGGTDADGPPGLSASCYSLPRGLVAGFRVSNFSVKNGMVWLTSTLRYRDGATERRRVRLVREDGAWKIAADS